MRKSIFLLVALLLMFSCAPSISKKSQSAGDIYVEGVNYLKAKKYAKAIEDFSYIRESFPFDPLSFVAMVKLGDVYFEQKEFVLASGVYEDFLNAHPEDENVPYVLTRLGACYEKLSLSLDRDQAYTLKALEKYVYLKNRFSASSYAKDVDKKIRAINQKLADRELYIGEFYYKTNQYNASVLRLEYFLNKFADANGVDKALFYLSMSYMELGNMQKSEFYSDILRKEYPKSQFVQATLRKRKTLQLASADAGPGRSGEKPRGDIILRPELAQAKIGAKDKKDGRLSFFDGTKPIDIISDTMEGFDKEKYVIFKGHVVARQEDLFIFSDTIEAHMNEATNEIEKAYAKGNVKIVKKERTSTCKEAVFDNRKGEITLKGDVIVFSGADKLMGDVVTYYVNEDRVVVEGEKDKKARITVTPK